MKVKIDFSVDIDPEVWALEYNLDKSEVRGDVKAYFKNVVTEFLRERGALVE